jgi:hypothetical protein
VLTSISKPKIGCPREENLESSEKLRGAKVLGEITRTYLWDSDSPKNPCPVLLVEGKGGKPSMVIDGSGAARLIRDRKTSKWSNSGEYVFLNSRLYYLSDKPFEEPLSKVFELYERAIAEATPAQLAAANK